MTPGHSDVLVCKPGYIAIVPVHEETKGVAKSSVFQLENKTNKLAGHCMHDCPPLQVSNSTVVTV